MCSTRNAKRTGITRIALPQIDQPLAHDDPLRQDVLGMLGDAVERLAHVGPEPLVDRLNVVLLCFHVPLPE
jgi:hypothetical protein